MIVPPVVIFNIADNTRNIKKKPEDFSSSL